MAMVIVCEYEYVHVCARVFLCVWCAFVHIYVDMFIMRVYLYAYVNVDVYMYVYVHMYS